MSTPSIRVRAAGNGSQLRAADADREQIADQLRTSHAEGRIDLTEFQERLERCYEAKTFGELAQLVSDLPRTEEPGDRRPVRRGGQRPWLLPLIALLFVFTVASSAAGHHGHHPFFLIVPIVFLLWRMTSMRRARWSAGTRGGPGRWA